MIEYNIWDMETNSTGGNEIDISYTFQSMESFEMPTDEKLTWKNLISRGILAPEDHYRVSLSCRE